MQRSVAHNPAAPAKALTILTGTVMNTHQYLAAGALRRGGALPALAALVAAHDRTPPADLQRLSELDSPVVRAALARNPNTPRDALDKVRLHIRNAAELRRAAARDDAGVATALITHPATTPYDVHDILAYFTLHEDDVALGRRALATDATTLRPEHVAALIDNAEDDIDVATKTIAAAAARPECPTSRLDKLGHADDPHLRLLAAQNPAHERRRPRRPDPRRHRHRRSRRAEHRNTAGRSRRTRPERRGRSGGPGVGRRSRSRRPARRWPRRLRPASRPPSGAAAPPKLIHHWPGRAGYSVSVMSPASMATPERTAVTLATVAYTGSRASPR